MCPWNFRDTVSGTNRVPDWSRLVSLRSVTMDSSFRVSPLCFLWSSSSFTFCRTTCFTPFIASDFGSDFCMSFCFFRDFLTLLVQGVFISVNKSWRSLPKSI